MFFLPPYLVLVHLVNVISLVWLSLVLPCQCGLFRNNTIILRYSACIISHRYVDSRATYLTFLRLVYVFYYRIQSTKQCFMLKDKNIYICMTNMKRFSNFTRIFNTNKTKNKKKKKKKVNAFRND